MEKKAVDQESEEIMSPKFAESAEAAAVEESV